MGILKFEKGITKKFLKTYREYFKRSKSLLTKRFNFLKDEEKQQVNIMLYKSENIRIAHSLKEEFLKILSCKNRKEAKKRLSDWIMYAQESNLKSFELTVIIFFSNIFLKFLIYTAL